MADTYRAPRRGDRVHFWTGDAPPLSQDYKKPSCLPAVVITVHDDGSADLGVLYRSGLIEEQGVPRSESFAATPRADGRPGERSYGNAPDDAPGSWHVDCGEDN